MPFIDIENQVFAKVAVPLREEFPGIFVSGEYVDTPAKFPATTIYEVDNSIYKPLRTRTIENAVKVLFEVSVYTNRVGYKKQDAQEIMSFIDNILSGLGFTRTMCSPLPNLMDATIYRLTARYEALVGSDHWIYTA